MAGGAVAQDAESRLGQAHPQVAFGSALEVVAAEPQEGEMVVGQPVEKDRYLGELVGRQHTGGTLELPEGGGHPAAHRMPVLDGVTDVAQHALEVVL